MIKTFWADVKNNIKNTTKTKIPNNPKGLKLMKWSIIASPVIKENPIVIQSKVVEK